jgi:hypothetical protein
VLGDDEVRNLWLGKHELRTSGSASLTISILQSLALKVQSKKSIRTISNHEEKYGSYSKVNNARRKKTWFFTAKSVKNA